MNAQLPDVKTSSIACARGVIDWKPAFLSALENVGVICKAAEAAKVSVMTVWRERKSNPEFAAAYNESLGCGALFLEAEAIRRAKDGVVRMKFNSKTGLPFIDPRTGDPYMEHEYSDALMVTLLKRHIPEYREPKEGVTVNNTVSNFTITLEQQRQIQASKQRAGLRDGIRNLE
jgi:hypothetical protein